MYLNKEQLGVEEPIPLDYENLPIGLQQREPQGIRIHTTVGIGQDRKRKPLLAHEIKYFDTNNEIDLENTIMVGDASGLTRKVIVHPNRGSQVLQHNSITNECFWQEYRDNGILGRRFPAINTTCDGKDFYKTEKDFYNSDLEFDN